MRKPHRLNVVGDFYVEHGCCLLCGVPTSVAPDLFADADDGCWVKKQPTTDDEVARMREVMHDQDRDCVRYRGRDPAVIASLAEVGAADKCDVSG